MSIAQPKLTQNACLYISLGFKQHFQVQILTLRRGLRGEYQMVIYDGLVYLGAIYWKQNINNQNEMVQERDGISESEIQSNFHLEGITMFDIVKIYPQIVCRNQPIIIKDLTVIKTGLTSPLGKEIITLEEYMQRRQFSKIKIVEQPQVIEQPIRKCIKLAEEQPKDNNLNGDIGQKVEIIHNQVQMIQPQMENKETQPIIQNKNISACQNQTQRMEIIEIKQDQSQPQILGNVKISNSSSSIIPLDQQSIPLEKKSIQISIQVDQDSVELVSTPTKLIGKRTQAAIHIKDLYQRMHRFTIQCRVNFITKFISKKGKHCTKLMLIDQLGDQIVCMLYEKAQQKLAEGKLNFVKGSTYVFKNGEVSKDEDQHLSISIPWSGVTPARIFMWSFKANKMMRVGEIDSQFKKGIKKENKSTKFKENEVNICGIFKGFKNDPKICNNHFRVNGTICDPDHQKQVDFGLYVDELSSFPTPGSVVSLHNIKIVEDQQIYRLEGNKRSYILNEVGNNHEYFSDLLKAINCGNWKLIEYQNMSEIAFTSRTISQLNNLLSKILQHDFAYSQIDCTISKIIEKRLYDACVVCRRETKQERGIFSYCYHCKKISKCTKRCQFDLIVSDATGSLELSLTSDDLEGFINMTMEEYAKHQQEDRFCFLELSTYQNILLKVKSERIIGGANHYGCSAEKPNYKRSLSQIKQKVIEQKIQYISSW